MHGIYLSSTKALKAKVWVSKLGAIIRISIVETSTRTASILAIIINMEVVKIKSSFFGI